MAHIRDAGAQVPHASSLGMMPAHSWDMLPLPGDGGSTENRIHDILMGNNGVPGSFIQRGASAADYPTAKSIRERDGPGSAHRKEAATLLLGLLDATVGLEAEHETLLQDHYELGRDIRRQRNIG